MKSNYQDFERYTPVDLAIAADAEATLPLLVEEVRRQTPAQRRAFFKARGARLAAGHQQSLEQSRNAAAVGWDPNPSPPRDCARNSTNRSGTRTGRCATGQCSRTPGRNNCGPPLIIINISATLGPTGLATFPGPRSVRHSRIEKHGRLAVAIGGDGDLMFSPGALWTAAHHRIPLLYVVHNNRAYHQEFMFVQAMAVKRQRGIERAHIGNAITDPNVDFAKLAASLGIYSEGPSSTRPTWAPPCNGPLRVVKQANRHWSTSSPRVARRGAHANNYPSWRVAVDSLSMLRSRRRATRQSCRRQALFLRDGCYQCHGTTGAGGGTAGPKLAPNPLPLEVVKAKLRTASGRMPVYTPAVVTDAKSPPSSPICRAFRAAHRQKTFHYSITSRRSKGGIR